jgi:hypothetical protein
MSAMPDRFPSEVAEVLRDAGWSEGRHNDEQAENAIDLVSEQVGRYGATIETFDAAVEALTEFAGIYVIQDGPGRDLRRRPFALDPTKVVATMEALRGLGQLLGTRLFPIGMEGHHDSILAIDESGRVFALDHGGVWYLGDSLDAALVTLITGAQPPRLNGRGEW